MFYTRENSTPSVGSCDSGDGSHGSSVRNLSGLLDFQKRKGVGAGLLTVTGKTTSETLFLKI